MNDAEPRLPMDDTTKVKTEPATPDGTDTKLTLYASGKIKIKKCKLARIHIFILFYYLYFLHISSLMSYDKNLYYNY